MVTQYLRRIGKRSSIAGQVPTIPISNDHTDGTWLVTDIYEGELFTNLVDKKVYTRCGGTIVQLNIDDATLSYILANIHVPNTDLYLDFGGANQVSAADIKLKLHTQNTDTILDDGGVNETSASEIRTFIDSKGQPLGLVPLNASGIIDDQFLSIPTLDKGEIAVNTDFPLIADVQKNWWYRITATVTDNAGALYTNTGLSFVAGDEIYWTGSTWEPYGNLQTSDRQPQIIVRNETQLINAYDTLKTTGGGTIVFGADITLSANRSFDNSGIKVIGGGYKLIFGGYTITITNRSCYFENVLFQGNGSSTLSIINFNNATYDTSQFIFFNCRFHNCVESNYNTIGLFDSIGFVGSLHLVFNQCQITSVNSISSNYLSIKIYGNLSSAASITVLGCKSVPISTQTNKFGWIGTLYSSENSFISDGSGIYSGLSLGVNDRDYCIIGSPLITTRTEKTSTDANDFVLVYDSISGLLKKLKISNISGTTVHNNLTGRDVSNAHPLASIYGITDNSIPYVNATSKELVGSNVKLDSNTLQLKQNTISIASSNSISLTGGNSFNISGTTQINRINSSGLQSGTRITLKFEGVLVLGNNKTASTTYYPLVLSCGKDFTTYANQLLEFELRSDNKWYEIGESSTLVSGSTFWSNVIGTPTRVSNTQFTITDTSNALGLQNVYSKGTVLKWLDSGVTKMACVTSASYATNTVTVNILGDVLNAGFTSVKYSNVKAIELSFAYNGLLSATATDICRSYYSGQAMKYFCVEANCTAGSGGSGSTTIALKSAGVSICSLSFANTDTNKLVTVTDLATVAANSKITWDITAVLTSPTTFHSDLSATIYAFPLNTIYLT